MSGGAAYMRRAEIVTCDKSDHGDRHRALPQRDQACKVMDFGVADVPKALSAVVKLLLAKDADEVAASR